MSRMNSVVLTALIFLVLAVGLTSTASGQEGINQGVVNPNLAGKEELMELPHLNEAIVKNIHSQRPFLTMMELEVLLSGSLNEEQLTELYAKLFVPINLNATTREEILLVPGVGRRMAGEFEEYRPYHSLTQFRREIGKYVEDEEVAQFEQYVFVPMDLNSASDEAIRSIPGVGRRMLREIKKYRPYGSMEQFRREIGKYVDDKEVARLERYVTLEASSGQPE